MRLFLLIVMLLVSTQVLAERKMGPWVSRVHKPITNPDLTLEQARLVILNGMLYTKNARWLLEREEPGAIYARFDYRAGTVVMKIVYDQNQIQLQYHEANGTYVCQDLEAGVCYENPRHYYNYAKNFRASIEDQMVFFRRNERR